MVQIIGPQVVAKPKMKKQAKQMRAMDAPDVFSGLLWSREKAPTEAKTIKHMNIQMEPMIRDFRRP
jgi:hypothetical protein